MLAAVRANAANLTPGEVVVLENLRFEPGEEANDLDFARRLAGFADVYVDDAFGASHRAHASVAALPSLLPSAAGRLLEREVHVLSRLRDDPGLLESLAHHGGLDAIEQEAVDVMLQHHGLLAAGYRGVRNTIRHHNRRPRDTILHHRRGRSGGLLRIRRTMKGKQPGPAHRSVAPSPE